MTTRKAAGPALDPRAPRTGSPAAEAAPRRLLKATLLTSAAATAVILTGCATPGPLHVYSVADPTAAQVQDRGPGGAATVSSFVEQEERISGFAYDPFTDHFFLRLEPGNRIRVVDRPARAVKREFAIAGAPEIGGGDLAVRPRDGHIFLVHPTEPALLETTRFGELRRAVRLQGVTVPPIGVAYDSSANELLILHADGKRVSRHAPDGGARGELFLAERAGRSLGYDSERREIYAPLADRSDALGVFDSSGKLVRREPAAGRFVDVGMRSFVRVF